jgi:DNA-binding NarL/FixJ family response regulator
MRNPSRAIVRILAAEDHEPFRRFLHLKLQERPELQIVAEASDGLLAVHRAVELQPDLILLDSALPTLNGITAARLVPRAIILFLSQENDADIVAEALSNGPKGFVRKQNASTDLLPAIAAVFRGDRFVSTG